MTTSTLCPKCGLMSAEPDYCSECGTKLGDPGLGATLAAPAAGVGTSQASPDPASPAPGSTDICPTCQTVRPTPSARFCEVCRYDFVKGGPGEPPVVPTAAPVTSAPDPVATAVPNPVAPDPVAPVSASSPPAATRVPASTVTGVRW